MHGHIAHAHADTGRGKVNQESIVVVVVVLGQKDIHGFQVTVDKGCVGIVGLG